MGRFDDSVKFFEDALREQVALGARYAEADTSIELARLLAGYGEDWHPSARRHLDRAIAIARPTGMKGLLQEVGDVEAQLVGKVVPIRSKSGSS